MYTYIIYASLIIHTIKKIIPITRDYLKAGRLPELYRLALYDGLVACLLDSRET